MNLFLEGLESCLKVASDKKNPSRENISKDTAYRLINYFRPSKIAYHFYIAFDRKGGSNIKVICFLRLLMYKKSDNISD